jgi:hypothetical protein
MTTLRLIKPTEASSSDDEAPPADDRAADARIQLESLPTPLRASVRYQDATSMTLAAELPWLAVGTGVQATSADGVVHAGRVESFDVEVTSSGAARLLIFADLLANGSADRSTAGAAAAGGPARTRHRHEPRPRRRWPVLLAVLLVLAAAVGGYVVGQRGLPFSAAGLDALVRPAR